MNVTEAEAKDGIFRCPGCDSDNTHIRMIKRPKEHKKKSLPSDKMVKIPRTWDEMSNADVDTPEQQIHVRRKYTNKFLSIIGLGLIDIIIGLGLGNITQTSFYQSKSNPTINPPEPAMVKEAIKGKRNWGFAQYSALSTMIHAIRFKVAPSYF
jgi:hypothetical protein